MKKFQKINRVYHKNQFRKRSQNEKKHEELLSLKEEGYTIFVGGLSSKCEETPLKSYFLQFGSIIDCKPQTWKKNSSKCRGFAILRCEDFDTYKRIISEDKHLYNGRNIECKEYFSSKDKLTQYNKSLFQRKVLISGFNENITTEDLENFFSKFGEIEIAYSVKSCKTGKSKGYGYVCFKEKRDRDRLLQKKKVSFKGDTVTCVSFHHKQVKELEKQLSQNKVENIKLILNEEVKDSHFCLKEEGIEELPTTENTPVVDKDKKKDNRKVKVTQNLKKYFARGEGKKEHDSLDAKAWTEGQVKKTQGGVRHEPQCLVKEEGNIKDFKIREITHGESEEANLNQCFEVKITNNCKKTRKISYSLFGGFKSRNLCKKYQISHKKLEIKESFGLKIPLF